MIRATKFMLMSCQTQSSTFRYFSVFRVTESYITPKRQYTPHPKLLLSFNWLFPGLERALSIMWTNTIYII